MDLAIESSRYSVLVAPGPVGQQASALPSARLTVTGDSESPSNDIRLTVTGDSSSDDIRDDFCSCIQLARTDSDVCYLEINV